MPRQPIIVWAGTTIDIHDLGNDFSVVDLQTDVMPVATRIVLQNRQVFGSSLPDSTQMDLWNKYENVLGFQTYPGMYSITGTNDTEPFAPLTDDAGWTAIETKTQTIADAAIARGCSGLALDMENYSGAPDDWWDAPTGDVAGDRVRMHDRAESLAPILNTVGPCIIYNSSGASWPGSYWDEVQQNAGNGELYNTNLYPDFIDGLVDGGVSVQLADAVFHHGWHLPNSFFTGLGYSQGPGGTWWEAAFTEAKARTLARFPSGVAFGPMLWPDNQEKVPVWFTNASMAEAFEAATRVASGPVTMYQQLLGTQAAGDGALWVSMLAAIADAIDEPIPDPPGPTPKLRGTPARSSVRLR